MRRVDLVIAVGTMGLVSACGVDSYLTCGDACLDATTTDAIVGNDGSAGQDVLADVYDAGTPDVVNGGGLDANCHAPDASAPQWACPQSGCCPSGGSGYTCNSQGACCRQNGYDCQSASDCCGTCTQSSGGNGTCAAQCTSVGGNCTQSGDCCIDSWCATSGKCTTCTAHNMPCTSDYECCSGDACQNGDGGKTCRGN